MSKNEVKELLLVILIMVVNFSIAFLITSCLGVQNTVICRTLTATTGDITYEILLFWIISIIECSVYYIKYGSLEMARD